jgi:predicted outer membrane repeat protein
MIRGNSLWQQFRINDPARPRFRPRIEPLEDRWLPSVLTVTSTADSGPGTLRAELAAAVSGDTIVFALPNPSTIQLTSGTLTVSSDIQISGPGASALTINGNQTFSIFTVTANPARITGLTISGGGGSGGGGITNQGVLLLSHCVVTGNQTTGRGGGIDAQGLVTISDCTVSNNSATNQGSPNPSTNGTGGGIAILGGGSVTIANTKVSSNSAAFAGGGIEMDDGTLYLTNSSVVGNNVSNHLNGEGADGGGIDNSGGFLTITNSVIMGNSAINDASGPASGGGISSFDSTSIVASTIANNSASAGNGGSTPQPAEGGGLDVFAAFTLENCTVSGNHATSGLIASGSAGNALGGGVSFLLNLGVGSDTIINCTISGNVAALPAFATSGSAEGGGLSAQGQGPVNLENTIIAANTAATDTDFINQSASITAFFNLIGDGSGSNISDGVMGNQVGTTQFPINPKLAGLANYGGPTPTMALLPGSRAIDHGTIDNVTSLTDQRGLPRLFGPSVDVGAFEFQPLHFLAVGADLGGGPEVKVYDSSTGTLRLDFNAYELSFRGGVRVAVADINGDGIPDIITAPGGVKVTLVNVNGVLTPQFDFSAGRAPEIKVFSGVDGSVLDDFVAYTPSFRAGLFVAVGKVDGTSQANIFTAPDATGQPGHTQVSVFFNSHLINTGASLTPDRQFNAYDPGFGGGVRLAATDLNGDGFADIVTAPGIWSGPDIRIFDGKTLTNSGIGLKIGEFLAYDFRYFGGVFVATGDVNGDGLPDIVTGTNGNGGPETKAFSGANVLSNPTPTILDDFFAYAPAFNGGDRVAVMDVNGDGTADIITGAGPGGGPHVRIFDGGTGQQLTNAFDSFMALDPLFSGGVFVGAAS